jgi:hypothetical protein
MAHSVISTFAENVFHRRRISPIPLLLKERKGSLSHEIGPIEKFDLLHVKLSHMVAESDF